MSRKNEFRVYIKPLKRYATGYETILYHHQCNARHTWTVNISPEEYYGDEDLIVEQFTGLKDKNGKKIYEGDIVKVARSYGYGFLPKGAKAKIEFDEKELCYKLRGQGEFRLTAKKELEVIGNVHENPELLEGEK